MIKQIIVASHHGFCMGVKRAINIAEETSRNRKGRVTILNEIVHNDAVVERFKSKGVDQAKSVDDVTEGTLIISAHGVAPDVIRTAKTNGLKVIDATCPLVANIYDIIHSCVQDGCYIVHFGDALDTPGLHGELLCRSGDDPVCRPSPGKRKREPESRSVPFLRFHTEQPHPTFQNGPNAQQARIERRCIFTVDL